MRGAVCNSGKLGSLSATQNRPAIAYVLEDRCSLDRRPDCRGSAADEEVVGYGQVYLSSNSRQGSIQEELKWVASPKCFSRNRLNRLSTLEPSESPNENDPRSLLSCSCPHPVSLEWMGLSSRGLKAAELTHHDTLHFLSHIFTNGYMGLWLWCHVDDCAIPVQRRGRPVGMGGF